ncbi:MAG: M23 family metallopeptidase [Nitrospirae bacterium]|nr:M23 family metallopeptidase [Nitrospirota bacterium]
MLDILKIKHFLRKMFTPVTIMFVPHSKTKPLNFKVPFIGIFTIAVLCCLGVVYISIIAVNTYEYYKMKNKLNYYSQQFTELNSTITSLKQADNAFRQLFSLGNRDRILEHADILDSGSIDIDMENLKKQINKTIESVDEINKYLRSERDIYLSTPKGLPVNGKISSPFGIREHPNTGIKDFHSGIDISTNPGTPVKATADGIITFAGWNGGSGNLVAIEHGHGFSTFYAHNRSITVRVGQKVKRGEVISYAGSTGNSTGPHVHYEIWKNGKAINPYEFLKGRS